MSDLKKIKIVIYTYPELQKDIKVFVNVMEKMVLTRKGIEVDPTIGGVDSEPLQDRNVTSTTASISNK